MHQSENCYQSEGDCEQERESECEHGCEVGYEHKSKPAGELHLHLNKSLNTCLHQPLRAHTTPTRTCNPIPHSQVAPVSQSRLHHARVDRGLFAWLARMPRGAAEPDGHHVAVTHHLKAGRVGVPHGRWV